MPIGEGKKMFQYKRACIMLSLYDKFIQIFCIIVVSMNCV